jgi:hypothetical protein
MRYLKKESIVLPLEFRLKICENLPEADRSSKGRQVCG